MGMAKQGRSESSGKGAGGMLPRTERRLCALCLVALACVGLAFHTGTGTPSMLGISSVAAICPLGAVEAAIASRTIVPAGVIGLIIAVAVVLLVGRAFCSWGCPMVLLRALFGLKTPHERRERAAAKAQAGKAAGVSANGGAVAEEPARKGLARRRSVPDDAPDAERGGAGDSRMWVLGGAVLTTAAFGFPVFCLVCPVGLTFATIICLWRAIQFGEASLSLVVFPAILIIEAVVLRRWCHTLCPLGALMGLIARGNRTFRATLNEDACLQGSRGIACGKCAEACPEGIDLHAGAPTTRLSECVKCGECKYVCPVQAITFPFFPKSGERSVVAVAGESYASETEAAPVVQADAGKCTVAEVAGSNIESKGEAHE